MKDFISRHLKWFGHDTFKFSFSNTNGTRTIYFDPFQLGETAALADIIFISHEHFDHCSPEDVKKIQGEKTVVVGPADSIQKLTGKKLVVKPGDKLTIAGFAVEVVPAYNVNKNFHPRANGWVGYVVTIEGKRIYHAGDTDHIPEMKQIKADIALLPVSGTYVMTAEEAALAALDIKPGVAIPMHYGAIVGKMADAELFRDQLAGKVEVAIVKQSVE